MRLLVNAGTLAGNFSNDRLQGLKLRHVQVDEIWTFVLKKQKRIKKEKQIEAAHEMCLPQIHHLVMYDTDKSRIPFLVLRKC